jgi:hypothetical protein
MRLLLATFLATTLPIVAIAQSEVSGPRGAAFFGFRTYWAQKRDGCRPMLALKVRNASSAALGPIELRMQVVDTDRGAVFANGLASVPSGELPPGQARDIVIGGDHDITAHECLGDMHETAFSGIHFVVRVSARAGQDAASVEIVGNEPMTDVLRPAQE